MAKPDGGDRIVLKLTAAERDAVATGTRLRRGLKRRLADAPPTGAALTRAELTELADEVAAAARFLPPPYSARVRAVQRKLDALLGSATTAVSAAGEPPPGAFRLKVTLADIKPPVWRRVVVPDCSLATLHAYLQAAFGWQSRHLHQFEVGRTFYGVVFDDGLDVGAETLDERSMTVGRLVAAGRDRWGYEYDMGDGWRHDIRVERAVAAADPPAPACPAGARACPPEDCGGPWGYAEYVAAVTDPRHPRHRGLLDWNGPFAPEAFDSAKATRAMRRVKAE